MLLDGKEGRVLLPNGAALTVEARGAAELRVSDGAIELCSRDAAAAEGDHTIALVVRHPIDEAVHVWVPHLTPGPENVIGDWVFRSPAIIVADREIALAFVADVDDVRAARAAGSLAWLDYDHPRGAITLAAGAYRHEGHVFFVREPAAAPRGEVRLRLHVVASTEPEDLENPYGMAARWCWARWGRPAHARAVAPPLSRHMERVVRWAFSAEGWAESVWQPVEIGSISAGAPVFIVDVGRHPSVPVAQRTWREPRSIWNQAWFSTQRCANGLLRYARQTGSRDLEARARQMTEIALAAPQADGLFPAVLVAGDGDAWRWSSSDRRPPSATERACHVVDAAFTCRMLLEWHALTGDERARAYVLRFAERLLALQRPSGAFPGWVEPDGSIPAELAEGPESAVSAALLLELGDGDERWRDAALRALPFLEGVTHDGRWEDFETYYSCARWGEDHIGRRVARNGVYKQNTLSIAWCAEAFLRAWRATRDPSHLRLARRCVDELSLYQAVWDPPFLPAPALGGFGVMNADSEWNDARQSLFAQLYLELGEETGDRELVERGVAALRASFSMLYAPENAAIARAYERRFPFFGEESHGFMMENQGHDPSEPVGTFTIFTWGNGSALASVATARDRFPDVALE
ncbi:MAG: hypothetical protein KF819_18030 [Labilithrix sp.]|nr:hypothetical protein [Labilithrix sp.]